MFPCVPAWHAKLWLGVKILTVDSDSYMLGNSQTVTGKSMKLGEIKDLFCDNQIKPST